MSGVPLRCFTCGSEIGGYWGRYDEIVKRCENENLSRTEELNKDPEISKIKRMCCRRILMTHVPIEDVIVKYKNNK